MKRIPLALLSMLLILTALLSGCRERIVYEPADWLLLVEVDPDEGEVTYNGSNLYVDADFSDTLLEFKLETHAAIPNPYDDVILAIYFDMDQDAATGLSEATGWDANVTPNNIGAEFMMIVGAEFADGGTRINEDSVYAWDSITVGWGQAPAGSVQNPYRPANTDSIKGGVNLGDLANPTGQIDVVAILLCDPSGVAYYDHIPDNGHATIDLAGDSVIQASAQTMGISSRAIGSKRVSLITGKELILEEVR